MGLLVSEILISKEYALESFNMMTDFFDCRS